MNGRIMELAARAGGSVDVQAASEMYRQMYGDGWLEQLEADLEGRGVVHAEALAADAASAQAYVDSLEED